MGILNTPLIPLMPKANLNNVVLGTWIGGSVDSTGTASILGGDVKRPQLLK
jgi:hypothetical protein